MKPMNLQAYLAKAHANVRDEPAFFQALLDAAVYVHMPHARPPDRLQFAQFVRPDNGQTVLPFFSDEIRAYVAAGVTYRVETMTGRALFEHTRGATLMLNPNEERCVLYPEEIRVLLEHGEIGGFHTEVLEAADRVTIAVPTVPVRRLIQTLVGTLEPLAGVSAAYMVETRRESESFARPSLMIGIRVAAEQAERAVRAGIAAVQPLVTALTRPLTFTTFSPDERIPDLFANTSPFYEVPKEEASGRQ